MGTQQDGAQKRRARSGLALVVAVWAGWAVAVLMAPILKQAEHEGITSLLSGAGGGKLVRIPVRFSHRGKAAGAEKMDRIVRDLADMYSEHCSCAAEAGAGASAGGHCLCAEDAKNAVAAALDNAIDREFAPPNMYYRSKSGYAMRLRGFQGVRTHKNGGLRHVRFLHLDPQPVHWREPRKKEHPTPKQAAKSQGLPPMNVQERFLGPRDVFGASHFVNSPSDDPAVSTLSAADTGKMKTVQRTTKLWGLNVVPLADEEFPGKHPTFFEHQAALADYQEHLAGACEEDPNLAECKDLEDDEDEGGGGNELDELLDSKWFEDWMDYSKLILDDSSFKESKIRNGIPDENNAAFPIPYQEGEEADWADWVYAFDDDAVRPLRLVEGDSNFPEMDANINAPGAVLEDYPEQVGGGESFANFLKHPAGERGDMQADGSSVNGWLSGDSAY